MRTYLEHPEPRRHAEVAKLLLWGTQLVIQGERYRIGEVEFYRSGPQHHDPYVHGDPDQLRWGSWYFHKFKNGTYKNGTFKGLDLTLGKEGEYYGILLRSIYHESEMIEGPCKVVNKILELCGLSDIPSLAATGEMVLENGTLTLEDLPEFDKIPIYYGPRVGLNPQKSEKWARAKYRFAVRKVKKERKRLKPLPPKVVHLCRKGGKIVVDCDLYIGRAINMGGWHLPKSKWASPFKIKDFPTREECVAKYEEYLLSHEDLLASLPELTGKTLGCWCAPEGCHGDVLRKWFIRRIDFYEMK